MEIYFRKKEIILDRRTEIQELNVELEMYSFKCSV